MAKNRTGAEILHLQAFSLKDANPYELVGHVGDCNYLIGFFIPKEMTSRNPKGIA
jgi:hypothetical protein